MSRTNLLQKKFNKVILFDGIINIFMTVVEKFIFFSFLIWNSSNKKITLSLMGL